MATIQNYQHCYPYCPPLYFPPPPKAIPPPPPHHQPPHAYPSPPPHHFSPPPLPPHVLPPPPPPSGHHQTVIIVIFVSLGGVFFLAFLSVALCCFIKKGKKKAIQETDIVRMDEHVKIKEAIVPGPHGTEAVILSIDEDVHIEEVINKNEMVSKGINVISAENHLHPRPLKSDIPESEN